MQPPPPSASPLVCALSHIHLFSLPHPIHLSILNSVVPPAPCLAASHRYNGHVPRGIKTSGL